MDKIYVVVREFEQTDEYDKFIVTQERKKGFKSKDDAWRYMTSKFTSEESKDNDQVRIYGNDVFVIIRTGYAVQRERITYFIDTVAVE